MNDIFIGTEELAKGTVSHYELRKHYKRVLPDVYGPRYRKLNLAESTAATWLWSKREGVVAGLAAAAVLGSDWVDADIPIELVWPNRHAPKGVVTVVTRDYALADDEVIRLGGLQVTSATRTAFDLARRGTVGQAVARLDALARATRFERGAVTDLGRSHPHARGLRRLDRVLDLVDAGAASPQETRLRMWLIEAGYPRPVTQIPILGPDGYPMYYLDMGWPDVKIAVEYDGEGHQKTWREDIIRSEYVTNLGWIHIRVASGNTRPGVLRRVERAWRERR